MFNLSFISIPDLNFLDMRLLPSEEVYWDMMSHSQSRLSLEEDDFLHLQVVYSHMDTKVGYLHPAH